MVSHTLLGVTWMALLCLCVRVSHCSPLFYNISMDGSGDEPGLELIFPTALSTRDPVPHVTVVTEPPSLQNTITTTIIRLKDYVLSRVVDFLQENLLIIIVVTSLLIVMVFIICCASAMSHKRKLEAYKPLPSPPRKNVSGKGAKKRDSDGDLQERLYSGDHVKMVQHLSVGSPKQLREPSKALVGERGRDVKWSPRPEARKVRDVEAAEKWREEPKHREPVKPREEAVQSPIPSSSSTHPVCTCHLKKAHH